MANTIFKLRRSSVAGKVPNTSSLSIGELAINLSDRKLYSSDGTYVFETGANLNNLSVTSNASIANLTVSSNTTVNNLILTGSVFANGTVGTNGQVLITNGSGVYWGASGGSANGILDVRQQYVGDGSTNTYTVTGGYKSNDLSVFINGVMLRNGVDVNVTDGGTFSFTTAPANGALIDVIGVGTLYANGVSTTTSQQFTANGTTSSFTVSGGYVPYQIQVYLNGVKQIPGTDVIVSSGNTVDFSVTPSNGFIVDVFGYQTSVFTSVNVDSQYVWTNTHIFGDTVTLYSTLIANGSAGSSGQVLHSNGSGLYWGTDADYSTNTDAQYTWTNTHTFTQTIIGTVNSALYIGSLPAANVVSNAQLIANLANYQTTAGLVANVAGLTSNNTQYVGSISSANVVSNAQLQSNLTNYQTTAGLAANVLTLTANNTTYVGTVTAANVVSNAQLQANLANYPNTTNLTNNLANYALLSGATFTGNVVANNANTTYDLRVGRDLYITGNLVVGSNVTVIGANNISTTDNMFYLNANATNVNPDVGFAAGYNDGSYHHTGFFRDATDGIFKVFDNYGPEPDASIYIDTSNTTFHLADFQANTLYLGNTSINWLTANISGVFTNSVSTGNSTVNSTVNTSILKVSNTIGTANITPTSIFLGNSSVNCVINSTSVYVNGVDYNPTTALAIAVALS